MRIRPRDARRAALAIQNGVPLDFGILPGDHGVALCTHVSAGRDVRTLFVERIDRNGVLAHDEDDRLYEFGSVIEFYEAIVSALPD